MHTMSLAWIAFYKVWAHIPKYWLPIDMHQLLNPNMPRSLPSTLPPVQCALPAFEPQPAAPPPIIAPACPVDVWQRVMDVNVTGALRCTQAFLPLLRAGATPGRIINISSIVSCACAGGVAMVPWPLAWHAVWIG